MDISGRSVVTFRISARKIPCMAKDESLLLRCLVFSQFTLSIQAASYLRRSTRMVVMGIEHWARYSSEYWHWAGTLMRHLKTHSGEKSNKCNQCNYASSGMGHLRRHLKVHNGKKSNKCNQCNFATAYITSLRTHMKKHSGEKSNKCNQCDFASSNARTLWDHL